MIILPGAYMVTLDVDAKTGEILFTQQILDEIAERGNALAQRSTSTAG